MNKRVDSQICALIGLINPLWAVMCPHHGSPGPMSWAWHSAGAPAIASLSRRSLSRTSLDLKVSRNNWWPSLRGKIEGTVGESWAHGAAPARLNSQKCLLPGVGVGELGRKDFQKPAALAYERGSQPFCSDT